MFQIGESLREARIRRGLEPADVHKAIRIRERYLTALEEERWDMLPGEAYTKGFLRTYADYLGLNGQLYIDEYNGRIARREEEGPPLVPHPSLEERGRVLAGRGFLLAVTAVVVVAAVVVGLVAWRLGGSSSPPRGAAATPPAGTTATHPATTAAATTAAAAPKPPPAAGPVLTSISAARGRCWLLVRAGGPHGAVVFQGVLEQGQVKRFRFATRLWLRMGRPSALDITLAGKPVTGLPASPSNLLLTRAGAVPARAVA